MYKYVNIYLSIYIYIYITHAYIGDMDEESTYTPVYQWRKNGLNITNFSEGHNFFTIKKFKSSDEGVYQYVAIVLYPNQIGHETSSISYSGTKDLILSETVLGISSKFSWLIFLCLPWS
jgi:hypothetical protein